MLKSPLAKFLFSNKLTVVLLFVYAGAMAWATFVENDFGTPTARALIYDNWWFELVQALLAVNFVGNIFRYKLLRKEKLSVLTFHLAFVFILLGALITRYFGYEGTMRIREGSKSNITLSEKRYLQVAITDGNKTWEYEKRMDLATLKQPDFDLDIGPTDNGINVSTTRFVPKAVEVLVDALDGGKVLEVVGATESGRADFYLKQGERKRIGAITLGFDSEPAGDINFTSSEEAYFVSTPEPVSYMVMASQRTGMTSPDKPDSLQFRTLYKAKALNFVVSAVHEGKTIAYETTRDKELAKNADDLLFVNLAQGERKEQVILESTNGLLLPPKRAVFGDLQVDVSYGSRIEQLPFDIRLTDFELERYPGSTNPSAYSSEVVVEDGQTVFPYKIFMNNVLDHRGYRFFQASYDNDELGTVLSVNRDFWGTNISYLGYFLMSLGMLLTLFGKKSRFRLVAGKLDKLKAAKAGMLIAALAPSGLCYAQEETEQEENQKLINMAPPLASAQHAEDFGALMLQDMDGRFKPVNSLASEFLRKVTGRSSYKMEMNGKTIKLSADQVFLSLHMAPNVWQNLPLIKVDQEKGLLIQQVIESDAPMVPFVQMLDGEGGYLLSEMAETAHKKKPAERNESDKEIIKVDERFNVLFQGLSGNYLKIFPRPRDPDHNWYNAGFDEGIFEGEDARFVRNILPIYFKDVVEAQATGDYAPAAEKLRYISTFQETIGEEVLPTMGRRNAELLYNKLKLFNHLFGWYWILGIILLILAVVQVFNQKAWVKYTYKGFALLVLVAFGLQTFNMILRWYAAGFPPWSNGYEMIILVSWALLLFGFIFSRKSNFILPMVALFGGTLLFVAFLDWLNPEITNLVPVLKSYWLKIHVAIIVSSYAPLALSALLGFLALVLINLKNTKFKTAIKELTYINELSMTIGIFMLAIGTFLGGVWANESWGRYWGWDPKETWALISIIIYAIVLHLRLIPKLKSPFVFNVAALFAFWSIIMTSFGVNYYLAGLHSYAKGDPLPIPSFVYWVLGTMVLVSVGAYFAGKPAARFLRRSGS